MKTIGLIGGTTWESTKEYYRIMNEAVQLAKGGDHSAKILLYSVDFHDIRNSDWKTITSMLINIGKKLELAGADLLVIGANTLHKSYDQVKEELNIPVLHIADVLAREVQKIGFTKIGLLGTKITMESDFYGKRLLEMHQIEMITPNLFDREIVSDIIFNELAKGEVLNESREKLVDISEKMAVKGAQGIVAGCTELSLILSPSDLKIPLFDTLLIHAAAAVNLALK